MGKSSKGLRNYSLKNWFGKNKNFGKIQIGITKNF